MKEEDQVLIVGLGNPEHEYGDTRHNLGFACVRELSARFNVKIDRKRWRSLVGRSEAHGVWMVLPQTYMNLSGEAVKAAVKDIGIDPADVWVVHDELDLPLCRLRINRTGSGAGHNGVLSVISSLGTKDFVRFRVGIGKPAGNRGVGHVLGRFTKAEAERVPHVIEGVADALQMALESGLERTTEKYNRRGSLGCEELA